MYIKRSCNFHKSLRHHSWVTEKFYDLLGRPSYIKLTYLFDEWTSLFGIMSQYDPAFDLKINVTYISWSSDFSLFISWLFDVWTSYIGIMGQSDLMFDLKINVYHCGLYFMVQWVLPYILKSIIWWMNVICVIVGQCDTKILFIMVFRSEAYISWSIDFPNILKTM